MKYLSIVIVALTLLAAASCHKPEPAYSYVKKSSRGNYSINIKGKQYTDSITPTNSSNYYLFNTAVYDDTGYVTCVNVNIGLYDSQVNLSMDARKLDTTSKIGIYRMGLMRGASWWITMGSFSFNTFSPYSYYNGNSDDTTGASFVNITSFTDNGKVQEIKGTYKLRAVYPDTTDITGNFDIRR